MCEGKSEAKLIKKLSVRGQTNTKNGAYRPVAAAGVRREGGSALRDCAKCTKIFQTTKKNLAYITIDKKWRSAYALAPSKMHKKWLFWEKIWLFYT